MNPRERRNIMAEEILHDGMCPHCEQVVNIPENILKEADGDLRVAAQLTCNCPEAKIFAKKYYVMENAMDTINKIIGKESPNPLPAKICTIWTGVKK